MIDKFKEIDNAMNALKEDMLSDIYETLESDTSEKIENSFQNQYENY